MIPLYCAYLARDSVSHFIPVINQEVKTVATKGLFTWRWKTPGKLGNLPVHIISQVVTIPIM